MVTIDQTTVLSLLSTLLILLTAYFLSLRLLPKSSTTPTRILFIWHAFDALIHIILEGGYLFCSFFCSQPTSLLEIASGNLAPGVSFLGDESRVYGAKYGLNPLAALWREYARADRRWETTDLTVISLELLTVFIGAPLAIYICSRLCSSKGSAVPQDAYFWMTVLATGELYGGFMTFAPEWLSANTNLTGPEDWMLTGVYLGFFNLLWVFVPVWVLVRSYRALVGGGLDGAKKRK